MNLRFAKRDDDVQSLWNVCFPNDTLACYFEYQYDHSRALLQTDENNKIVSMLHWFEQELFLWGENVKCAYVLGVGTHPDYRKQGLAGELCDQLLFELHLREIPLAFLIPSEPSLVAFYEKYGFRQLCSCLGEPLESVDGRDARPEDIPLLNELYEKMLGQRSFLKRTALQWAVILKDYEVIVGTDGYAVYNDGKCLESSKSTIVLNSDRAACVRVVQAKDMISLCKRHNKPIPGAVVDKWCPWNSTGGDTQDESLEGIIFKNERPYVNLLYNDR